MHVRFPMNSNLCYNADSNNNSNAVMTVISYREASSPFDPNR